MQRQRYDLHSRGTAQMGFAVALIGEEESG